MIRLYIDNGSGYVDYTQRLESQSLTIEDLINQPTTCDFSLTNLGKNFVVPRRSAYLKIESQKYSNKIFTGFITNEPEKEYLSLSGNRTSADRGALLSYKV